MNIDDLLTAWADTQRMQPDVADRILRDITEPLPADWWVTMSNRMAQTFVDSTRMPTLFTPAA